MDFVIVLIVACGIFALCFAVFLLKARRSDEPPRLHTCGQGDDCRCHGQPRQHEPFDLLKTLDKVKQEGQSGKNID